MKDKIDELINEHGLGVGCLAIVLVFILCAALIFGVLCLEGWILMLLWNWVVPVIWAGAPTLTYWVAVGVLTLLHLIGGCFKTTVHRKNE
jgi:hypothetical protein